MKPQAQKYIIVGGSAAGMAAAEALRAHDADGSVLVLTEEGDRPYFRPLIPFLVSGRKSAGQIGLQGSGPYTASGIDIRTGTRVSGVNAEARRITTDRGETVSYDRLLIATGSAPFIPPDIAGADIDGVFALRTLEDARRLRNRAVKGGHAVMLGGGLLNLKAAFALLECGLQVTLVVYSPEVLSQLMEPNDAGLIRTALDRAGLCIVTGRRATKIVGGDDGVAGVVLDDGSEMPCDIVCIGKGVRPNTGWIPPGAVDVDGGVVVDRHTRSSADGVYAAGDVAVTVDPITGDRMVTGLWTNAVEMGRCAGANMAGRETVYGGTFGILNATQVAKLPFVSMGIVHTAGTALEVHTSGGGEWRRKMVFSEEGDWLVGALFVGDIAGAGMYRSIIRERMNTTGIKRHIVNGTLHYGHLMTARS